MKGKRIGLILISIIVSLVIGGLTSVYFIPWVTKTVSGWGSSEIMTCVTLMGVFVALSVPFINIQLKKSNQKRDEKSVYQIDIQVDTSLENNMVRFSASIQNVGDKTIETKVSNLYIDQGIPVKLTNDRDDRDVGVSCYKFPFILEHKETIEGRPDCVLCKKCFRENNELYPEEIVDNTYRGDKNLLRTHILLEHLSHKSIQYINPKEKFSEDVILQFKEKGVYRVTFFVGTEGESDCECATKQFYIPESLSNQRGNT